MNMSYTEMMDALEEAVIKKAKELELEGEDGYRCGVLTFPEADSLIVKSILLRHTFNSFKSTALSAGILDNGG